MSTPKSDKQRATPEQVFALAGRFATEVNSWNLAGETVQAAKDEKDHPLWSVIKNFFQPPPEVVARQVVKEEVFIPRIQILRERPKPCAQRSQDDQITDLKRMYEELRWTWTDSGLVIPKPQKDFDRLLVFADPTLSNNRVFDVCDGSFACWRYANDLDAAIPAKDDQRHPSKGSYAIWVRDQITPDQDLMGLSANQIKGLCLKTETLLEYMLHHLIHFRETGEHLDPRTWTLCAGSRGSGGNIPWAIWDDDEFEVCRYPPVSRSPDVGPRQAVTL